MSGLGRGNTRTRSGHTQSVHVWLDGLSERSLQVFGRTRRLRRAEDAIHAGPRTLRIVGGLVGRSEEAYHPWYRNGTTPKGFSYFGQTLSPVK